MSTHEERPSPKPHLAAVNLEGADERFSQRVRSLRLPDEPTNGGGGVGRWTMWIVCLLLAVSPDILAVGVLLTLLMGLAGGLLPALSAIRLKPLEALR